MVADIVGAQRELFGVRPRAKRGHGARHRILIYLKAHVGEEVSGEQLATVSGIGEWARRVRELRDEYGYDIAELGGSMYRLDRVEPNEEKAAQWRLANSIRQKKGSALDRIKMFFEANEGNIVTRDQIDYVARIKEGSRRVRELRDEHGWPINSFIDEEALRPGEYRLVSADPSERRDTRLRVYPDDLRERIFKRDHYTCQVCGRNREAALRSNDTRFYLELHHRTALADELEGLPPEELNQEENLVTLCHRDHVRETAALQERKRRARRKG